MVHWLLSHRSPVGDPNWQRYCVLLSREAPLVVDCKMSAERVCEYILCPQKIGCGQEDLVIDAPVPEIDCLIPLFLDIENSGVV